MNNELVILKQTFTESKKHFLRLEKAAAKLRLFMPLNPEKYLSLSDDEVAYIDQFIFRFSKLQDSIGNKLLKSILSYLGEDTTSKPFIDIFNRLEQLGIISDYDLWLEIRNLRNELSHDYEDDPKETSEKINHIFERKNVLEKYFTDIERYLIAKGLEL